MSYIYRRQEKSAVFNFYVFWNGAIVKSYALYEYLRKFLKFRLLFTIFLLKYAL